MSICDFSISDFLLCYERFLSSLGVKWDFWGVVCVDKYLEEKPGTLVSNSCWDGYLKFDLIFKVFEED